MDPENKEKGNEMHSSVISAACYIYNLFRGQRKGNTLLITLLSNEIHGALLLFQLSLHLVRKIMMVYFAEEKLLLPAAY